MVDVPGKDYATYHEDPWVVAPGRTDHLPLSNRVLLHQDPRNTEYRVPQTCSICGAHLIVSSPVYQEMALLGVWEAAGQRSEHLEESMKMNMNAPPGTWVWGRAQCRHGCPTEHPPPATTQCFEKTLPRYGSLDLYFLYPNPTTIYHHRYVYTVDCQAGHRQNNWFVF